MDGAPLTFPVPLPVIMDANKKDNEPMAVKVTNLPDVKIQEDQLESSDSLLTFFKQFWTKEKKYQPLDKLNLKMAQAWDKIGITKFATGITKGLKSIVSGLASFGGGLLEALLGLMVFAWLDPSGGFLASMISLLANFVVMFIDTITRLIPTLIPILVKIIPVLIKAFGKIIEAVAKMIPVIIDALVKGLPLLWNALKKAIPLIGTTIGNIIVNSMQAIKDKLPFLEPIINFIEQLGKGLIKLFDPNGGDIKTRLKVFAEEVFSNFISALKDQFGKTRDLANEVFGEKNIRTLEALMILYGAFSIALWAISGVLGLVNVLLGVKKTLLMAEAMGLISVNAGLGGMVAALWALVAPMIPIILTIGALMAAFVLLYVYWDEVVDFFYWVGQWLKDSFIELLEIIPEQFDKAVDWVADGFNSMVNGVVEGINSVTFWFSKKWNSLTDWISDSIDSMIETFMDFIELLLIPISWPLELAMYVYKQFQKNKDKIYNSLNSTLKIFTDTFQKIKDIFAGKLDIGDSISRAVKSAFQNIPGMSTIRDWFEDLVRWIENSDVYKLLSKAKKAIFGSDEKKEVNPDDFRKKWSEAIGKQITYDQANFVKNYVSYGEQFISKGFDEAWKISKDDFDKLTKAVKESKVQLGDTFDSTKMESILKVIAQNTESKSNSTYNQPKTAQSK